MCQKLATSGGGLQQGRTLLFESNQLQGRAISACSGSFLCIVVGIVFVEVDGNSAAKTALVVSQEHYDNEPKLNLFTAAITILEFSGSSVKRVSLV